MRSRLLSPLLLLLAGCHRGDDPSALLSEARQRLAARDAALTSYVLEGSAHEGSQTQAFQFAYRAPNKMLGVLGVPATHAWAWDGEHLVERDDTAHKLFTYRDTLSPEQRAGVLTQLFSPFAPEGFRAPLLPGQGVSARKAPHPRGPEAVELSVRPSGSDVEVVYVLRWPSMDFLGKRVRSGQDGSELRVEEEQCDKTLSLCVPRRWTQWEGGQAVAETRLTRVELNPTLPADTFALPAPGGYAVEPRTLAQTPAQ